MPESTHVDCRGVVVGGRGRGKTEEGVLQLFPATFIFSSAVRCQMEKLTAVVLSVIRFSRSLLVL